MKPTPPVLDLASAAEIDFPLLGEWVALNTPAERVPSHGTDYFGQRFAFDFVRIDKSGDKFYPSPVLQHLLGVLSVESFLAWDAPVVAAFDGEVIQVGDDWPDRRHVNALWELARASFFPVGPDGDDFRPLAGNHVIVQGEPGVAMYGHLRCGSIGLQPGDRVVAGDPIGRVGNSGNSTMPHLHFQLMSDIDPRTADGRLCVFRGLERQVDDYWIRSDTGIPGLMERVRRREETH